MKTVATILLSLACFGLEAQQPSYKQENQPSSLAKITDPALLAFQLTNSSNNDQEKVEKIFHWITDNIVYFRPDPILHWKQKASIQIDEEDDFSPLRDLNERVAISVLKKKSAVCEGYARLFKSLCQFAGIKAEIITGYARANQKEYTGRFISNHSWNAVFINEQWHLLDVTWASGHILASTGEFIKQYNPFYFLVNPKEFIKDHYPDDIRWTLLSEIPTIDELKKYPFKQRSFFKYGIHSFSPAKGVIDARIGDTLRLELETKNMIGSIAPDSLWEDSSLIRSSAYAFVQPVLPYYGTKVHYYFPVQSENVQWLFVMLNNDAVLRYRINIQKEK